MSVCRRSFNRQGIKFERFAAIDGKLIGDFPDGVAEAVDTSVVQPLYNATRANVFNSRDDARVKSGLVNMSFGEIASAYSHASIWAQIAAREDVGPFELACIFEDDVVLEANFEARRNVVLRELPTHKPIDLLYLMSHNFDAEGTIVRSNHTLVSRTLLVIGAYCLSVKGARKLISALPVDIIADIWLTEKFPSLQYRAAWPNLARHIRIGKSDTNHSFFRSNSFPRSPSRREGREDFLEGQKVGHSFMESCQRKGIQPSSAVGLINRGHELIARYVA